MLKIGNITIRNRVVAAPLAGVTDKAFRLILKSFGCGLVYTEMISDKGLIYQQRRTLEMSDTSGEERPVAVQIFGSEIKPMVEAAQIVAARGADIIDINMGCPTPKIVKNGEGAALMGDINKSRQIIKEVVQATDKPVSVKMRKGWDDNNITCFKLAEAAEREGACAVTIHPRTRMQFFSGKADWSIIKEMVNRVSIPVIGNGDIECAEDAQHMLEETGCDAVMIGRAALGNPFIYRETVELLENGRHISTASIQERVTTAIKHLNLACDIKGEAVAVREMRKHFSWYVKGIPGAAKLRNTINRATTRDELINLVKQLVE